MYIHPLNFSADIRDRWLNILVMIPLTTEYLFYNYFVRLSDGRLISEEKNLIFPGVIIDD